MLKDKAVLVTGGAGFIGSHLVDRIIKEQPSALVVVDNFSFGKISNLAQAQEAYPALEIIRADASNYRMMKHIVDMWRIDTIFNLAILALPASLITPDTVYRQNIDITLTMCELLRKRHYRKLVHVSSSEAYGQCQYEPMDEAHPLEPRTSYGASKASSDLLVLSYYKSFGVDAVIARPFNAYGIRQNDGLHAGIIPLTVSRILCGNAPIVYGDGYQTRDYTHVLDTAHAIVLLENCPEAKGKAVNIASNSEVAIRDLVTLIAQHMKCDKPIKYAEPRIGDLNRLVGDNIFLRTLTGFEPSRSFTQGIKETVQWFSDKGVRL